MMGEVPPARASGLCCAWCCAWVLLLVLLEQRHWMGSPQAPAGDGSCGGNAWDKLKRVCSDSGSRVAPAQPAGCLVPSDRDLVQAALVSPCSPCACSTQWLGT